MRQENILIIRFSALGDIAMTVPVIYSLARQYPSAHFSMLSRGFAKPLFENLAPNVNFIEADLKHKYHGIKGLNALYRQLADRQFTAVADLHDVLRTKYLRMRFCMAGFRVAHIDKHRQGKRRLVASKRKQLKQQPTSFHNYAEVFARLGFPVKITFTSLFPPSGGNLSVLPPIMRVKMETWIGIAPFAAHEGKIYPLRSMQEVIRRLTQLQPNCRLFLFGGGEKEKAIFRDWCNKFNQCVNVPEHLSGLHKELVLMSHLDAMVSMDSANMHLASLAGIPVISIWGATHPFAGFMGWGQKTAHTLQLDLPCRPCSIYGNKKCALGDYPCLKGISPEQVVERIEAVLNENPTSCTCQ